MLKKQTNPTHEQTIFKWFFRLFTIVSLIFCFALIPAMMHTKNTFFDLQIEKRKQLLDTGADKLSSIVSGTINASASLYLDSRFAYLHSKNIDYEAVPISTQQQMKYCIDNLTASLDIASHIALQLNENIVVTYDYAFFENSLRYYPDFFQVDDLDSQEWRELLQKTGSGFLPVSHIKAYSGEYDALIYVTPWGSSGYVYSCINVKDIKKEVIEEANLSSCYYTITTSDGQVLYSDLPEDQSDCQTLAKRCSSGNIVVSIHIPNSILTQNMRPFYLFFGIYVIVFVILFIFISLFGSRQATKPIMNIIEILDHSRISKPAEVSSECSKPTSGFEYISSAIINAEQNLQNYQFALQSQRKLLQTRFIEKALNGQLASKVDIQNFNSYFTDFPKSYRLLLIKLWTYTGGPSATLYQEPLLLLQSFLETECPKAYQHQINDTNLLLILPQEDYVVYSETITFMIRNINEEEPTYHASCIASDVYYNLDDLPTAYQQVTAISDLSFTDYQTHICTTANYVEESKIPVTITDLMTLYTAITSANLELAMSRLKTYSEELCMSTNVAFTKPVYEIIRSILAYIKVDYSQLLVEQHIPRYELGISLYDQLSETVKTFCVLICEYNNIHKDSFTQELSNYIDAHYTDCDICLTSLKTHFKCSESTIRKVFKHITDVPIARYIEQKRMILANELLAQGEKSVTEIALECGYLLPHSFYKAYKRVYGHAPTLLSSAPAHTETENDSQEDL